MRKSLCLLLVAIIFSLFAGAQDQQESKRPPSTPDERKRFMTVVQKLEQSPLDKSLLPEVKWAKQWLEDVPDINVTLCPLPLGEFFAEDYRHKNQLFLQFAFAMAAFLIQHPDKAADKSAQYLAGVEGVLRTYKAILKSRSEAKSRALDELLARQSDGSLNDMVREASRLCEDTTKT